MKFPRIPHIPVLSDALSALLGLSRAAALQPINPGQVSGLPFGRLALARSNTPAPRTDAKGRAGKVHRMTGALRPGSFGAGLSNKANRDRARQLQARPGPRDEHGAVTLIGRRVTFVGIPPKDLDPRFEPLMVDIDGGMPTIVARRKWLGGISAQRGY